MKPKNHVKYNARMSTRTISDVIDFTVEGSIVSCTWTRPIGTSASSLNVIPGPRMKTTGVADTRKIDTLEIILLVAVILI